MDWLAKRKEGGPESKGSSSRDPVKGCSLDHEVLKLRTKRHQLPGDYFMKGREGKGEGRGHLRSGEESGGVAQPPTLAGGDGQPGHVQGQDQKWRQAVCISGRQNGSGQRRDWPSSSLRL